jgi:hypothetical protein
MAKITPEAAVFFKDIRESIDILSKHFAQISLADELDEFTVVHKKTIQVISAQIQSKNFSSQEYAVYISYMMQGLIHSVLVSIDGGSSSADNGRQFRLVDNSGNDICPALHEYFVFEGNDKS